MRFRGYFAERSTAARHAGKRAGLLPNCGGRREILECAMDSATLTRLAEVTPGGQSEGDEFRRQLGSGSGPALEAVCWGSR